MLANSYNPQRKSFTTLAELPRNAVALPAGDRTLGWNGQSVTMLVMCDCPNPHCRNQHVYVLPPEAVNDPDAEEIIAELRTVPSELIMYMMLFEDDEDQTCAVLADMHGTTPEEERGRRAVRSQQRSGISSVMAELASAFFGESGRTQAIEVPGLGTIIVGGGSPFNLGDQPLDLGALYGGDTGDKLVQ